MSEPVLKKFGTNEFLNERHGRELLRLEPGSKNSSWFTAKTAMLEIIKKSPDKPTAKYFKREIGKYNQLQEMAK